MTALLEVRDLGVSFGRGNDLTTPVDGVSFSVQAGESLGLVGESGCGKTLTGLALLGLLPAQGRLREGSHIRLAGQELVGQPERAIRRIRGRRIGMIFQDPMMALNPVLTIGAQLVEALRLHERMSGAVAVERATSMLSEVGLPEPGTLQGRYPHELSGGMRQRVMIALALAGNPELLVADEATTALDVTVQAQVLALLDRLRMSRGLGVVLVTHDLGIVAGHTERVAVMYAGRIVETASTTDLFGRPAHPYTRALLAAVPTLTGGEHRLPSIPGSVPDPAGWPSGCRFHPRCESAMPRCASEAPPQVPHGRGHEAECWLGAP